MKNTTLIKAAILGLTAVLLGAFGAHALKEILSSTQLISYKTGVHYQLTHAVVLLFLFLLNIQFPSNFFKLAAQFIFWGVILFSGSIYLLTLRHVLHFEVPQLVGAITPIGGLLIIIGWGLLLWGAIQLKKMN